VDLTFALLYHDLSTTAFRDRTGFPGPLAARYKLEPDRFSSHLEAISAARVEVGLVRPGAAKPRAALTFDDGGSSAIAAATELERHGWRGHFFITTGRIGTPGFLDASEVAELHARGHLIGSHSASHPTYMGRLPSERIHDEWTRSSEQLEAVIGERPVTASVPGGFVTAAVMVEAAKAGYRVLMTSEPTARVQQRGELIVLGRYAIRSNTPASLAAAYAIGSRPARARVWLSWTGKKASKRAAPSAYEALRRLRARAA